MSQFIHVGFGNIVNTAKIIAVVSPDSAPIKRMVQTAREAGTAGTKDKGSAGDGKRTAGAFRTFAGNHCKPRTGRTGG